MARFFFVVPWLSGCPTHEIFHRGIFCAARRFDQRTPTDTKALPGILFRYFARQFLAWFALLSTGLLVIVWLIETLELMRRGAGKDVPLGLTLEMGLFKLASIGQQIIPFAILFAAMLTFWRLTRSNELVVTRAAGVSVWRFTWPVLVVAALVGVVRVTFVHPVGAALIAEYNRLDDRLLKRKQSAFEVSRTGLWLRQQDESGEYFIHAGTVDPLRGELREVMILKFTGDDSAYTTRVDAESALLRDGHLEVHNGLLRKANRVPQPVPMFDVPTSLTFSSIEESFAPPETVSFWGLPRFITILEQTGFSAIRHRLHYQSLLAQPVLFCAMVLLAAAFSLRQTRRGGTLWMVSGGVMTGFILFVFTDVALSLGVKETIPVVLAAWAPATISLLLGLTALLHLEDG